MYLMSAMLCFHFNNYQLKKKKINMNQVRQLPYAYFGLFCIRVLVFLRYDRGLLGLGLNAADESFPNSLKHIFIIITFPIFVQHL